MKPLIFLAGATDQTMLVVGASLLASIITALGVIFAARYGWIGKRSDSVMKRLADVEAREEKCQNKLFRLRHIVTGLVLANEILSRACPDADKEVQAVHNRLKERLREYDAVDEEDVHITQP